MKKIILEGITGSGKSLNVNYLKEQLREMNYSTVVADCNSPVISLTSGIRRYLRENGEPLISQMLLNAANNNMKLLGLKKSDYVIVDRFLLSNLVYSLAKAEMDEIEIDFEKTREGILRPFGLNPFEDSATIYFHINSDEAMRRTNERNQKTIEGDTRNNFNIQFQSLAKKYYEIEIPQFPEKVFEVDANQSKSNVRMQLDSIIEEII